MPRILMLMGSGETSPTMVKFHREIFARLPKAAKAVILDTPFGFQGNADDIAQKAIEYFKTSIGATVGLASMRDAARASSLQLEAFANQLRDADYVFAGPGSPTYALRQWSDLPFASILAEKLTGGGVVAFSSAAVLTLGRHTIPVYEIYKVGEPVELRDGLDVLSAVGLKVLVIPHFNNAEGQNHDTRFCYMGRERLDTLISQLDEGCSVIGIDEHTGIMIDLDSETVRFVGLGTVTLMQGSGHAVYQAGEEMSLEKFRGVMADLGAVHSGPELPAIPTAIQEPPTAGESPLLASIESHLASFDLAITSLDSHAALESILDLEEELSAWSTDTLQSDEMDKGRAALRSMISRLEPLVRDGLVPAHERVQPFVETIMELRAGARRERRWSDADAIRDRLDKLGIVVQDAPEGAVWHLAQP
ncbi:MAG: hypothetical protein M0Z29_05295 [Actinomycetota bacterium]|nr:hypothetical protein [Actinomycetota bacterium]